MINKKVKATCSLKEIASMSIQSFIEPIKNSKIVINTIDFSEDEAYPLLNETALSLGISLVSWHIGMLILRHIVLPGECEHDNFIGM